jgi:hypothetical protein
MTKAKEYWAVAAKEDDVVYLFDDKPIKNKIGAWIEDPRGTRKVYCMSEGAFPEFPKDNKPHRITLLMERQRNE